MIMRPGQPLLLPASPWFIWISLLCGVLIDMLPTGRQPWMPDLLALVLVFWSVHQPLRVGIVTAFAFGVAIDVHQTSLLGQHALSYSALSYLAITVRRRMLWLPLSSQTLQVLPLFVAAHAIEVTVRLVAGNTFPGFSILLAPLAESLLWPVASVILLAPQRGAHDPDENRPL